MSCLISVIVPIFNSEHYLCCCIDSILAQTFSDFELLLIDDGSSDASGRICDKYALEDARVKVFHKENGGVSSARNIGLKNAKGKWVAFVDSDDYLKKTYLANLFSHVDETLDLIISFPEVVLNEHKEDLNHYQEGIIVHSDFEQLFYVFDMHEHTSPWGKLFRFECIQRNNLRFYENLQFGEDTIFFYSFLLTVNDIYICNICDYCYRGAVEGSLSKKINPPSMELDSCRLLFESVDKLIKLRCITNEIALLNLNCLREVYIWRLLNSLYHFQISREERIKIIKTLDLSVLSNRGYDSYKTILLKFLLRKGFYSLYDFVRCVKIKSI